MSMVYLAPTAEFGWQALISTGRLISISSDALLSGTCNNCRRQTIIARCYQYTPIGSGAWQSTVSSAYKADHELQLSRTEGSCSRYLALVAVLPESQRLRCQGAKIVKRRSTAGRLCCRPANPLDNCCKPSGYQATTASHHMSPWISISY